MLSRFLGISAMALLITCMPSDSFAESTSEGRDRSLLLMLLPSLTFRGQSFERNQWAEAGSCLGLSFEDCLEKRSACPRGPMVHDLLNTYLISDKTLRTTALQLLGSVELEVSLNGKTCDAYRLGMCTGFEEDVVYVCYGPDGTVSSAGLLQP